MIGTLFCGKGESLDVYIPPQRYCANVHYMQYRPTIGLEIHAELNTVTKMFCCSKNDPNETRPNMNICPICLAHPGTLPVINRTAIMHVLRVGTALGGKLADYTEFDRKNYFYPDLPKGYQISQYEFPLVSGGSLVGVQLTRIHLEEDTASSTHFEGGPGNPEDSSQIRAGTLIDFNRAGVPLMELVTEPVIASAAEAAAFARELQLLLRYLGASEANMEKGQMRVEANISISANDTLGTKVEVKNLNSFRAMERAVEYEIERQAKLLEEGKKVLQETRGWNESEQITFAQRIKESSADYRYFPDPDLPSLRLSDITGFGFVDIAKTLPELPEARRQRYIMLGLTQETAASFVRDERLAGFFDEIAENFRNDKKHIKLAANYIANDLVKILRDTDSRDSQIKHISIPPSHFQMLMVMITDGNISSRSAKDILKEMVVSGDDPEKIARKRKFFQSTNINLDLVVDKVIAENAIIVEQYRVGKTNALEFLVGQGMKSLRGVGNPTLLKETLQRRIGNT